MSPLRQLVALCASAALLAFSLAASSQNRPLDLRVPRKSPVADHPQPGARTERIGGEIESLLVHDRRHGTTLEYFTLREANGTRTPLRWLRHDLAVAGTTVQIEGRRTAGTLFVDEASLVSRASPDVRRGAAAGTKRYTGTLQVIHVDEPDHDRCELHYVLEHADGAHLRLAMANVPDVLREGMPLAVDGVATADGLAIEPSEITIEANAAPAARAATDLAADMAGTTNVLVVLVKFADTAAEPYTRDGVLATVFTGASSVANYFREVSYGKHTLAGTVTPWLRASFNRPASCDYSRISSEGMALARANGYDTNQYQKYVFVFPSIACGWQGLGGGSFAWVNQAASTLVIGHELGHTFGLGHASSLRCSDGGVPSPLDGSCSRSEYGDGYAIMGNNRAGHLSAPHKVELGYIGTTGHKVHKGGTATYTLSPYATAGGTTYAVKVPATPKRTYWLEWRQPVGFDAAFATGITGGALVHTAYPSDYGCDSCLLDMAPATTTYGDSALRVGQSYTDADAGATIAVLSQTASALTVRVTTPTRPTFSDVPTSHGAYQAIEALAWHGIAIECAPGMYCPERALTRAEMAAFLERAKRGPDYAFTATGTRFADMGLGHWATKYAEQAYLDGITVGCATDPLRYCPEAYLSRAQMATMLLKARYGSTFAVGTATGSVFVDVPATHPMAAWIERLYSYQVTLGCRANPNYYCPDGTVTRAQMALFIQRAFALALPPI